MAPGPGYQHSPWLLVALEARRVGMIISTFMLHLGVPGGRVPFASELSFHPWILPAVTGLSL